MDTTETYIKQCEKAVEIQKEWKVNEGDFYFTDYRNTKWLNRLSIHVASYCDYTPTEQVEEWRRPVRGYEERGIPKVGWLPRQDQLQEMVLNGEITWNRLAWDFGDFFRRKPSYANLFYTAEQAWLAFIMIVNYDKTWNGEDWVKG